LATERARLKKKTGHDKSDTHKEDLVIQQQTSQVDVDKFKVRLVENGVNGFSDTVTLHVSKTPPGDERRKNVYQKKWDEECMSL
jgi:hypothetical protein